MTDAALYIWDLAVAIGILGIGRTALRLLRIRKAPLALAGVLGVSLLIALGGWLNLMHLLLPGVFFTLIGAGVLLAIFELVQALRARSATAEPRPTSQEPLSLRAKLSYFAAAAVIGTLMLGGMRPVQWNGDDLQGYAALAVKAAQMHSVQPDPFCERRVQAGVGGANFLDTMMLAEGDLRAMPFIDATFGLFIYALGLWTLGRRWKTPPAGIALALLCIPLFTLMQVNLTIIYLSAAAFFAVLILLSDAEPDEAFGARRTLVLGIIVGAAATTKSTNIVFVVPFLIAAAFLHKLLQPRSKTFLPMLLSLPVAVAVFLPWSIANKTNAGTYLYPLLGRGIHVSAYHLIPAPSQLGYWPRLVIVLAPNLLFLFLCLIVIWKLTRAWRPWPRAAAIAFIVAALIAVPVTAYGLGGENADRYTAPFAMPSLLIALLIVCGAANVRPSAWRRVGMATLAVAAIYILAVGLKVGWYERTQILAYQAIGLPRVRRPDFEYMFPADGQQIQKELAYGARIQAALPPGATAISMMQSAYVFNFRRNTIYIADFPGMASPPPGLPIDGTAAQQRQFLLDHGVHYIILDTDVLSEGPVDNWEDFLRHPARHPGWRFFLAHQNVVRTYQPWSIVEWTVSHREGDQMYQIVTHSPLVYNDGRVLVARID